MKEKLEKIKAVIEQETPFQITEIEVRNATGTYVNIRYFFEEFIIRFDGTWDGFRNGVSDLARNFDVERFTANKVLEHGRLDAPVLTFLQDGQFLKDRLLDVAGALKQCQYDENWNRWHVIYSSESVAVSTPVGIITVEKASDPAYPGVWVSLKRPESSQADMSIALIEYDKNAGLITRVWGDADNEDYTEGVQHKNIDKFFAKK